MITELRKPDEFLFPVPARHPGRLCLQLHRCSGYENKWKKNHRNVDVLNNKDSSFNEEEEFPIYYKYE
jgi:hypothetical protein